MSLVAPLLMELEQEAETTKALFERIPEDKLGWKPHAKSMSLGQLALHIANSPATVAQLAQESEVPLFAFEPGPEPASVAETLTALQEGVKTAKGLLENMDDETVLAEWSLVKDGEKVMSMPRLGLLRAIMLNHFYHHRGQLTVYLRMQDVPLPPVYGASADENPLA